MLIDRGVIITSMEEFRKVQEKHQLLKNNQPTKEIQNARMRKDEEHQIVVKQMQLQVGTLPFHNCNFVNRNK